MTDAMFFAPGRVNLIGEHLDYNGGRCLPIALSVGTTVSVRRAAVTTYRSVQRPDDSSWTPYAAGVLAALAEDGHDVPPLHLVVDSSVPLGAGLGSSAALTCSVAMAALWAAGLPYDPELVISASRRAEAFAGAPTGGLDQNVAVHAEDGYAVLLDFADDSRTQVPWDEPVLVIDTQVRHAHTDGPYAVRRSECDAAAAALGVPLLAGANGWEGLDGVLAKRARHVVTEQARVARVLEGDHSAFTESHQSLRDDFEVSCPELDIAVEAAMSAGAIGARMTGGGFGGSAIALVGEHGDAVRAAVVDAFGRRGWGSPAFLDGKASAGARQVTSR